MHMIASSSESDGRGANSKSVASSRPSRDLGTPLVLVIEDDPDAAEVASGMLQMLGFRVKHYPDAHHALYSLAWHLIQP